MQCGGAECPLDRRIEGECRVDPLVEGKRTSLWYGAVSASYAARETTLFISSRIQGELETGLLPRKL